MKQLKPAPWHHETMAGRMADCMRLLYCHCILTDKEMERVKKRIIKWIKTQKSDLPFPGE